MRCDRQTPSRHPGLLTIDTVATHFVGMLRDEFLSRTLHLRQDGLDRSRRVFGHGAGDGERCSTFRGSNQISIFPSQKTNLYDEQLWTQAAFGPRACWQPVWSWMRERAVGHGDGRPVTDADATTRGEHSLNGKKKKEQPSVFSKGGC